MRRGFLLKAKKPASVMRQSQFNNDQQGNASKELNTALPQSVHDEKDLAPDVDLLEVTRQTEHDFREMRYDDGQSIFITLPPRPAGIKEPVPDGRNRWSECILHNDKQRDALLSIPNFPQPVPTPPEPRHRVGPTDSVHGLGLFATRDLKMGDLVFAERPLLVTPHPWLVSLGPPPVLFMRTHEENVRNEFIVHDKMLEVCLERMLPRDRQAFLDLPNRRAEDGYGVLWGRVKTNGIIVRIQAGDLTDEENVFFGTFAIGSHFNHCCVPNIVYNFNAASFCLSFYAIRPIKKEEEMFISFAHPSIPTDKRQIHLLPFGFTCTCMACSDPEWDARYVSITNSLVNFQIQGRADAEAVLKHSLKWIKIIEDNRLESIEEYCRHMMRVAEILKRLGKGMEGRKYEKLVERWKVTMGISQNAVDKESRDGT